MIQLDLNPTKTTLRNFGLIGIVAFTIFAAMVYWQIGPGRIIPTGAAGPVAALLAALAAYCLIAAATAPTALKPLYVVLSLITYPIGIVVSFIVLAAVYYLVITPVGIVFKIIGRDAMTRKFDPAAETYWIKRHPPDTMKRYFRQF